MLCIKSISVFQYKNYAQGTWDLDAKLIGIAGRNGTGKTNLLDAVYYLCFTKSYFPKPDAQSAQESRQGFRIDGQFQLGQKRHNVVCILRETNRKELLLDGQPYKKFSSHIGTFPCVFIVPDDIELVTGGSETRRSYIDLILSQLNPDYLQQLISYKKILDERNSLLKSAAERNYLDDTLLNILDEQLVGYGNAIYQCRKSFLEHYIPAVSKEYAAIAGSHDHISLTYYSQLHHTPFAELLHQHRQRDLYLQRTGCGVHKDDLELQLGDYPFKNMASQGQRKSLLFALKLAEYRQLKQEKGMPPLLLLDDVFEKLDAGRMHNLLHTVCVLENGQVLITDTHKERLQQAFDALQLPCQLIPITGE